MSNIEHGQDVRPGSRTRPSSRWFAAAMAATLVGVLLVALALRSEAKVDAGVETPQAFSPGVPESEEPLTIMVARTPGGAGEWANWARVIKYLSAELDTPVRVRYVAKDQESSEVMASEEVDIAFVCAHQYLTMLDEGLARGLCTPVVDGASTTRQLLVVRAEDDAQTIHDLEGAQVACSDSSALGGMSFLYYHSRQSGIDPEEFFGSILTGDTQQQNIHDLLAGRVRATVVSSVQALDYDMTKMKVVESSEPIGLPPVVCSASMSEHLAQRVVDALVSFNADVELPATSRIDGFVVLDPLAYEYADRIRDACGHHAHE